MKTAISIPEDLLRATEAYARSANKSRSQVIAEALRQYLPHDQPEGMVESLNRVVDSMEAEDAKFRTEAARHVLGNSEW
jgi:metal-responsive CopG/Arc/MetJ family transcriptional regulator